MKLVLAVRANLPKIQGVKKRSLGLWSLMGLLLFATYNSPCYSKTEGRAISEKVDSIWNPLSGDWTIDGKIVSLYSNENKGMAVLRRADMTSATRWNRIRVEFRFDSTSPSAEAGICLDTYNANDVGILRIKNDSVVQTGRWRYGRFRSQLNATLARPLISGEWYRIEVLPTTSRKEWRDWTLWITSCETGEILMEQGINNDFALFGKGIVGLYGKGNISFRSFQAKLSHHNSHMGSLRLAPQFADGMVIQRNMDVPIWGKANPGAQVKVGINQFHRSTYADRHGNWRMDFPPLATTISTTMSVTSGVDSVTVHNVAIGEVWLASGQSNMQMKVWQSDMDAVSDSLPDNGNLRMFIQPRRPSENPVFDNGGRWEASTGANVKNWSAVAYSFALQLHEKLNVPVGVICAYWGGTSAESWLPFNKLATDSLIKPIYNQYNEAQEALLSGNPVPAMHPWNIPGQSHAPGYLYNGMIYPHIPGAIKGVIWYQGESNAKRAKQYETLFPTLIESWREAWAMPELPFLFVQLAGYDGKQSGSAIQSAWPQLRDAQRLAQTSLDHTGMAVSIDLGDRSNIHPIHKKEVGERLARLAFYDVYHFKNVLRGGPLFESITFKAKSAFIEFLDIGLGLQANGNKKIVGFEIAGTDRMFWPANAEICPDKFRVRIWSDHVDRPVAVRYAWENFPESANLINSEGLPASPFRTDRWPLPTDNNR